MASSADYASELSKFYGPQQLGGDTQKLYQMLLQSPMFQNALTQNNAGGAQISNSLNASLANRGLSTSGIGTIAGAIGGSASQFGASALKGGLFGTAGNMASENLLARLQAFSNYKVARAQQPSFMENLGGSLLGAAGAVLSGPAGASLFAPKAPPAPWQQAVQNYAKPVVP